MDHCKRTMLHREERWNIFRIRANGWTFKGSEVNDDAKTPTKKNAQPRSNCFPTTSNILIFHYCFVTLLFSSTFRQAYCVVHVEIRLRICIARKVQSCWKLSLPFGIGKTFRWLFCSSGQMSTQKNPHRRQVENKVVIQFWRGAANPESAAGAALAWFNDSGNNSWKSERTLLGQKSEAEFFFSGENYAT